MIFSTTLIAEVHNQIIFENFLKNSQIKVLKEISLLEINKNREISKILVSAYVKEESVIEIQINESIYPLTLSPYETSDYFNLKTFAVNITPIEQSKIKVFNLHFNAPVALKTLGVEYSSQPSQDQFKASINRLENLATFHLYNSDYSERIFELTRAQALSDLSSLPSKDALEIIADVVNYDPNFNNYEEDQIGRQSFRKIVKNLSNSLGEIAIVDFLSELWFELDDRLLSDEIIKLMYEFKTPAALFHAIDNHIYTPIGEENINHDSFLAKIYNMPEFEEYVHLYAEKIKTDIFGSGENNKDWDQERACDVFAKVPVPGLFSIIFPRLKEETFSFGVHCSKALISAFNVLDLSQELTQKDLNEAKTIILEKYERYPRNIFSSGYSYDSFTRTVAIYTLNEIESYRNVLFEALNNPHLEQDLRLLINELLK